MKNLILFNPAIGSQNVGDSIISSSIHKYVKSRFQDYMICELPTQMPVSNKISKRCRNADLKLVMGTNLLQSHMFLGFGRRGFYTHAIRQWDTDYFNKSIVSGSVLWGCGWQNYDDRVDCFTKSYWKKILSHEFAHSVRDEFTLQMLNSLGITNVINTGCPTTWCLTKDHCSQIPDKKAESVVTTITDYRKDIKRDTFMLRTLLDCYQNVFLWLQGQGDEAYINSFDIDVRNNIHIIQPNLDAYSHILKSDSIDYVGTRLHGGIYALQNKVRSIIIGIDNRALEMSNTGLCILPANEIEDLKSIINSDISYNIDLNEQGIHQFLAQFD